MIAHASAPAPLGCKAPIGRDETLDHRNGDLLGRQGLGETGRLRMHLGIGDQFAMKRAGQFDGKFHGLVVGDRPESELAYGAASSGSRIKSRVTKTRSAKPGRIVRVGAMFIWRSTSRRPD